MIPLDRNNYKTIAAKLYRNPVFSDEEFDRDLSLVRRVPRKIENFCETGKFNTRLVFNNFIIACNCFGCDFIIRMAFLLSDVRFHTAIYTFIDVTIGITEDIRINDTLTIKISEFSRDEGMANRIKNDLGAVL